MIVERTFWPVGHGAFYSELLRNTDGTRVNMVYDCGSLSKNLCLVRIEDFLFHTLRSSPPPSIDVLFITHFDADHINGISHLARTISIKNVVIPYFDDFDLLYLCTVSSMHPRNAAANVRDFLGLPKDTNIYRVYPEFEPENFYAEYLMDLPQSITIESGSGIDRIIRSRTRFCSRFSPTWFWSVFNYDRPHNTPRIRGEIQQLLIDHGQSPDNIRFLLDHLAEPWVTRELNRIYGQSTSKNNGSLVIYSGSTSEECAFTSLFCPDDPKELIITYLGTTGFVYMGDYNSKTLKRLDAYLSFISPYSKQLDGIQVPHHGSSNNFSSDILANTTWSVISVPNAGTSHNHPSESVWDQMRLHGFAYRVDEQDISKLVQCLSIAST